MYNILLILRCTYEYTCVFERERLRKRERVRFMHLHLFEGKGKFLQQSLSKNI